MQFIDLSPNYSIVRNLQHQQVKFDLDRKRKEMQGTCQIIINNIGETVYMLVTLLQMSIFGWSNAVSLKIVIDLIFAVDGGRLPPDHYARFPYSHCHAKHFSFFFQTTHPSLKTLNVGHTKVITNTNPLMIRETLKMFCSLIL